jgi:hypothetical protein
MFYGEFKYAFTASNLFPVTYKKCAYRDIFRAPNKKFSYDVKAKQLFEI